MAPKPPANRAHVSLWLRRTIELFTEGATVKCKASRTNSVKNDPHKPIRFSETERRVFRLLAEGKTKAGIAQSFKVTPHIDLYRSDLRRKLGIRRLRDLSKLARLTYHTDRQGQTGIPLWVREFRRLARQATRKRPAHRGIALSAFVARLRPGWKRRLQLRRGRPGISLEAFVARARHGWSERPQVRRGRPGISLEEFVRRVKRRK